MARLGLFSVKKTVASNRGTNFKSLILKISFLAFGFDFHLVLITAEAENLIHTSRKKLKETKSSHFRRL